MERTLLLILSKTKRLILPVLLWKDSLPFFQFFLWTEPLSFQRKSSPLLPRTGQGESFPLGGKSCMWQEPRIVIPIIFRRSPFFSDRRELSPARFWKEPEPRKASPRKRVLPTLSVEAGHQNVPPFFPKLLEGAKENLPNVFGENGGVLSNPAKSPIRIHLKWRHLEAWGRVLQLCGMSSTVFI